MGRLFLKHQLLSFPPENADNCGGGGLSYDDFCSDKGGRGDVKVITGMSIMINVFVNDQT